MLTIALALLSATQFPNPDLTPGEALQVDGRAMCVSGYSKTVRKTTKAMKTEAFRKYGLSPTPEERKHYEVDHRLPLCLGGADTQANLFPQPYNAKGCWAKQKDHVEFVVCKRVCADGVAEPDELREAQAIFLDPGNRWCEEYEKVKHLSDYGAKKH